MKPILQELSNILNDLGDTNRPITSSLLKAKILAKRLGNQELSDWLDLELGGYFKKGLDVPNYRLFKANLTGDVVLNGQMLKNSPLPIEGFSDDMKLAIFQFRLRESVENLENLSRGKTSGFLEENFDADVLKYWQGKLRKANPNLSLMAATRHVPITVVGEIISSIRQKLIDLLISLENNSDNKPEINNLKPSNNLEKVKDQGMEYKYDVALSFAGEDRDYVEKVTEILKKNGVRTFYDKFEEVDLWGKDLGLHFDYVYRRTSKYFIPFISKHYKEKIWTTYEVKTAIARAIENKEEYILPAKFDNTELDGIRSTLGFINISNKNPEEFAKMIIAKLNGEINVPLPEKEEPKGDVIFMLGLRHFLAVK